MLLSIPSRLDALIPTTEQFECTQVEVSLDEPHEACSIQVITYDSRVESVVSVPNHQRKMILSRLNWNQTPHAPVTIKASRISKPSRSKTAIPAIRKPSSTSTSTRSVTCPRPKSERRLSLRDDDTVLRGRDTQSCPPSMSRSPAIDGSSVALTRSRSKSKSTQRNGVQKRDTSCPPKLGSRSPSSSTGSKGGSRKRKVQPHPADSPTRRANKPDLVSLTSKRIIGSVRENGSGRFLLAAHSKRNRIIPEIAV